MAQPRWKFMPCPHCCPGGSCIYFSDDFSGTLAGWTQTSGSWSIVDEICQVSDADAVLTCDTTHPTSSTKYLVWVSVQLDTDGDIVRLYVNDSAQYAELERISSTCYRFRLFDGVTLVESIGGSLSTWTTISVCSDGDTIYAGMGGAVYLTAAVTVTSSVVAIGTGTCAGTVKFENVSISKHQDDLAICPACGNENCTRFSDPGCSSGSLSEVDYTITGTWVYDSNKIKCTADGSLIPIVVPTSSPPVGRYSLSIGDAANAVVGTKISLAADNGNVVIEAECYDGDPGGGVSLYWRVKFYVDGVQYGYTAEPYTGDTQGGVAPIWLCLDGTRASGGTGNAIGSRDWVPTSDVWTITVSDLSGYVTIDSIVLSKVGSELAGCPTCTNWCYPCATDQIPQSVEVSLAGILPWQYGCSIDDPLVVTCSPYHGGPPTTCNWLSDTFQICNQNYYITIVIYHGPNAYNLSAPANSWTLVVDVNHQCTSDQSPSLPARFIETIVSETQLDCLTAFDGAVSPVVRKAWCWWPDAYSWCVEMSDMSNVTCDINFSRL